MKRLTDEVFDPVPESPIPDTSIHDNYRRAHANAIIEEMEDPTFARGGDPPIEGGEIIAVRNEVIIIGLCNYGEKIYQDLY